LAGVAARQDNVALNVDDPMQHEPMTEGDENDLTSSHLSRERREENGIGVSNGWVHAAAGTADPHLAASSERVANETRGIGSGERQRSLFERRKRSSTASSHGGSAHSSGKSKPYGFDGAPRGHIVFVHNADRARRIPAFIASEQPS